MNRSLFLHNRQHDRRIEIRCLRKITEALLEQILQRNEYEVGIHFVSSQRMAAANEKFLNHQGSTDVITFDYLEVKSPERLAGDIFVCVAEAVRQAKLFGTTWQSEVVRYIVHGALHLCGLDDRSLADRKRMKKHEDRAVRKLCRTFDLRQIHKSARHPARKK